MTSKPSKTLEKFTDDERWEIMKSQGIEISKFEFHQPTPVFVITSKTVAAFKAGLKGLRIWRTPTCFLLELKNKRIGVENTAISTWEPL